MCMAEGADCTAKAIGPKTRKGLEGRVSAAGGLSTCGGLSGHRSTALAVRGGRSNSGAPQSPVSGPWQPPVATGRKCAQ